MKLRELVYDVIMGAKIESDDSFATEEYVEFLINSYRSRYIRRDYNKRPYITLATRQSIVIPMEVINSSVISNTLPTNTLIMRTAQQLPQFIPLGKHPGIFTISSVDRNIGEFELMEKRRAKYALDSPTCSTTTFLDTDNRLYLVTRKDSFKMLKYVVIDAVLEDPREALNYIYIDEEGNPSGNINPLTELETYPIDDAMWTYVKQDVINEILRQKSTAPDLEAATNKSNISPMSTDGNSTYLSETGRGL